MQDEPQPGSVRSELLSRLRSLDTQPSAGSLADIAYTRAKEALERALDEARTIRLQAIDDARRTRERELNALTESLASLRLSAEAQVESLLRTAEIEAGRLREKAESDAGRLIDEARTGAGQITAQAVALRASADERAREIDRLESEFNRLMSEIAERIGLRETPAGGWWQRLRGKR